MKIDFWDELGRFDSRNLYMIQHNRKDYATDLIIASRPVAYHVFLASEKTLFLVLFDATPFGRTQ